MEMLFGNKGMQHYIETKVGSVAKLENSGCMYQVQMLLENDIPFLWKPVALYLDGELWLKHNTEQYYVFERLLSQSKMKEEMLRTILTQMFTCIQSLEQYLLDPADLVINTDYMFWNPLRRELKMIYLPGNQKDIRLQLKAFLERVMKQFDHEDKGGMELLYGSYGMIADEHTDVEQLTKLIQSKADMQGAVVGNENSFYSPSFAPSLYGEENAIPRVKSEKIGENRQEQEERSRSVKIPILMVVVFCGILGTLARYFLFQQGKSNLMASGILAAVFLFLAYVNGRKEHDQDESDVAMREYELQREASLARKPAAYNVRALETELSAFRPPSEPPAFRPPSEPPAFCPPSEPPAFCPPSENREIHPLKLVPLTNGALESMQVSVDGTPVTVGRGKKEASYRVCAPQISRLHASVYMRGEYLCVKDRNSTNGTFVNSNRIPANQETFVKQGDVVAFANEEFYVS